MDTTLIVATGHGIFTYERNENDWRALARGLDGQNVTSAIAREGVILAGTTNGVFRSDDEFVGTEPCTGYFVYPFQRSGRKP
jgi:hypothetical protein